MQRRKRQRRHVVQMTLYIRPVPELGCLGHAGAVSDLHESIANHFRARYRRWLDGRTRPRGQHWRFLGDEVQQVERQLLGIAARLGLGLRHLRMEIFRERENILQMIDHVLRVATCHVGQVGIVHSSEHSDCVVHHANLRGQHLLARHS